MQARARSPDGGPGNSGPPMSLDPEQLEAAIRRDDAAGVRALLFDATEADRRECAMALRSLLDGPDLAELGAPPVVLGLTRIEDVPGMLTAVLRRVIGNRLGLGDPVANRVLAEWNKIRNSAAFLAAALGLARSIATAHIAADRCDAWWEPSPAEL